MQTQTVQNSPLLTGSQVSGRSSNAAQEDNQFAQALSNQIERQAGSMQPALPPQPAPAARRADAPKPAAQQPRAPSNASQQQAKAASSAPAPANKPAAQAQAPAKTQQSGESSQAAAPADSDTAPATDATAGADGADGTTSPDAGSTEANDGQQAASEAVADMLAMIQGLAQPATVDGATAAAAAAAAAAAGAGKDQRPVSDAAASTGDAVLAGNAGRSGIADRLPGEGITVDQAALLAAKAAAEGAGKTEAGEQGPALADALAKLTSHAAADDVDASATSATPAGAASDKAAQAAGQPRADFQAALLQASADASKAADAAARDAAHTAPAALQAATAQAPAGAANAQAAHAVASNQLHARVGSQGWDNQLGQKVVWMVRGGEQSATLTLNPPDLGPLQVVLNVSNDQASVAFMAAQPEVREALEQALPKLRETMGDAGIKLGDASVSAGSQDQQAFADRAAGGRGRGVANGQNDNDTDPGHTAESAPQLRRGVLSAVDTFA